VSYQRAAVTPARDGDADEELVSAAVRAGDLLFISAQSAVQPDGTVAHVGDCRAQAEVALERIKAILESAGGGFADVVDVVASFLDVRDAEDAFAAAQHAFPNDGPAWTIMGTQGFRRRGVLVELHAVAHLGDAEKMCFTPDSVGWMRRYPMSGACRKGEYVFVSGQMPVDLDGNVVNPGDHRGQSRFMFNRVKELLDLAGASLENDVLDLLSFSVDPRSFDPMCIDVGCEEFLKMPIERAPSWSVIGATALFRPGVFHTVRAIAQVGSGPAVAYTPESIFWRWLPVSGGTKKQDGKLLCVAGEVSMDRDGQIVNPGNFEAQARYAFNRISEVLELAGGSMDNVVDIISWHKDVRSIDTVLEVSREFFTDPAPAWSACGYPGGYFEGHLHEIYARAWMP
jgi:enamine deaminase RidA (YjgF/YER057c/UK114 family)